MSAMSTALALADTQGDRGELAHGAFEDENLVEQGMSRFAGLILSVEAGGSESGTSLATRSVGGDAAD